MDRRAFLGALAGAGCAAGSGLAGALWLGAAPRAWAGSGLGQVGPARDPDKPAGDAEAAVGEVVLYTSIDSDIVRGLIEPFEWAQRAKVLVVGDTEATKTTGLVQRVISERARPRADVFWSSEVLGMLRLGREGLLEPGVFVGPRRGSVGSWPWSPVRGAQGQWAGMALRPRVIGYALGRVPAPAGAFAGGLGALPGAAPRGRVGLADPRFGTTRGHLAWLLAAWGDERFGAWLDELKANGARVYPGNAAALRAVHHGQVDAVLTDADDVYAGLREGWAVGWHGGTAALSAAGVVATPSTVGAIRGGPNARGAAWLAAYLGSAGVERLMARTHWRTIPTRREVRQEEERAAAQRGADLPAVEIEAVRWEDAFEAQGRMLAMWAERFGG